MYLLRGRVEYLIHELTDTMTLWVNLGADEDGARAFEGGFPARNVTGSKSIDCGGGQDFLREGSEEKRDALKHRHPRSMRLG